MPLQDYKWWLKEVARRNRAIAPIALATLSEILRYDQVSKDVHARLNEERAAAGVPEKKNHKRRSQWDLIAGMSNTAPRVYIRYDDFTPMVNGDQGFVFPVFAEPCHRFGRTVPMTAIPTGVAVPTSRNPQSWKWGNNQLKTPFLSSIINQNSAFGMIGPNHIRVKKIDVDVALSGISIQDFMTHITSVSGRHQFLSAVSNGGTGTLKGSLFVVNKAFQIKAA